MAYLDDRADRPATSRPAKVRPAKVWLAYGSAATVVVIAAALIAWHVFSSGPPLPVAASLTHYAGSLELDASGSELASWNQTPSFCTSPSWSVPDGTVATDSAGDATLTTTGKPGSCVAIISPGTYSSGVVEADIDFPALPGAPRTIADWTSFWLTNQDKWPTDGEIDAVEVSPASGVNAVSYHWGTHQSPRTVSTSDSPPGIRAAGPNLTPGWHVVDVVFTKGFFAVYYDGRIFASLRSSAVTGSPLSILLTTGVTPEAAEQLIGGPPKNADSSPATLAIKYLKVWSYHG
jgi:Glycosyl hydrolases family 16